MPLGEWISGRMFQFMHQHNLVYNTCWEDPRLDRVALELQPHDTLLVITSAGCNALDYALAGPERVIAVDLNPRQNALLESSWPASATCATKTSSPCSVAGGSIKREKSTARSFVPPFPLGASLLGPLDQVLRAGPAPSVLFPRHLRHVRHVDQRLHQPHCTPASGRRCHVGGGVGQRATPDLRRSPDRFWTRPLQFALNRDSTLSLLGVPRAHAGKSRRNTREASRCLCMIVWMRSLAACRWPITILARLHDRRVHSGLLPRVSQAGELRAAEGGLVDRIDVHTESVQGFLEKNDVAVSRFVLLDHMDWMAGHHMPMLQQEWQWIVRRAAPATRLIWRSGGLRSDFVDGLRVTSGGKTRSVGELLNYHRTAAESLHQQCRVHTYGSFHIADLAL